MTLRVFDMFTPASVRFARVEITLSRQVSESMQPAPQQLRRSIFDALHAASGASADRRFSHGFRPALAAIACMMIACAIISTMFVQPPAGSDPAPSIASVAPPVAPIPSTAAPQMIIQFLAMVEQPISIADDGPWQVETQSLTDHAQEVGDFLLARLPFADPPSDPDPEQPPDDEPFSARKYLPPVFMGSS